MSALGSLLVNRGGAGGPNKSWVEMPHADALMVRVGASVCKESARCTYLQNPGRATYSSGTLSNA